MLSQAGQYLADNFYRCTTRTQFEEKMKLRRGIRKQKRTKIWGSNIERATQA